MSAEPAHLEVRAGKTASYVVRVSSNQMFDGDVHLSASGLPDRSSGTFSPNPIPAGAQGTSNFDIVTSRATTPGTYSVIIRASGTSTSGATVWRSTTVTLKVTKS